MLPLQNDTNLLKPFRRPETLYQMQEKTAARTSCHTYRRMGGRYGKNRIHFNLCETVEERLENYILKTI